MNKLKDKALEELKDFQDSFLQDKELAYSRRLLGACYDDDDSLLARQWTHREGFAAGYDKAMEDMYYEENK